MVRIASSERVRSYASALAASVAILALAACSSPGGGESTSTDTAAAPPAPSAPAASPAPAPKPAPQRASLPEGTSFTVKLDSDVVSDTATQGQTVTGRVASNVVVDGSTLIPAGTRVKGTVTEVKPAKRFGGQAMVAVSFTSVTLANGTTIPVEGGLAAYAKKDTAKDAGTIAGGTVGGAVLGKIIGKDDKDAAVGAIVGGGIATAIASRKGDEAFLPAGTDTTVQTTSQVQVPRA